MDCIQSGCTVDVLLMMPVGLSSVSFVVAVQFHNQRAPRQSVTETKVLVLMVLDQLGLVVSVTLQRSLKSFLSCSIVTHGQQNPSVFVTWIAGGPAVHCTVIYMACIFWQQGRDECALPTMQQPMSGGPDRTACLQPPFPVESFSSCVTAPPPLLPICHFGFVPVCSRKASNAITQERL